MKSVFDIVHRAQSAALAAARPGVECGLDRCGRAQSDRRCRIRPGLSNTSLTASAMASAWMATSGPIWFAAIHTKLQANMTTSDEPGIYIRGEFGVRLEDDMHVTENGAELFTPQSRSLEDPFGTVALLPGLHRGTQSRERRRTADAHDLDIVDLRPATGGQPGKFADEGIADVSQVIDSDFAGEESIGRQFAQQAEELNALPQARICSWHSCGRRSGREFPSAAPASIEVCLPVAIDAGVVEPHQAAAKRNLILRCSRW